VQRGYLSQTSLSRTRDDFHEVRRGNGFRKAGTGQKLGHTADNRLRKDETYWLERSSSSGAQRTLFRRLDVLRHRLNRALLLGLNNVEMHYAAYPLGGFYRRHLDAFQRDDERCVSFVLYLNHDWTPADGGQLRLYSADGTHQDVAPVGGTLVCFLSREKEHEVLPSQAERFSLTGWFKVTPDFIDFTDGTGIGRKRTCRTARP